MKSEPKIPRSTKGQPLPPLSQLKEAVRLMPEAQAETLYALCLSLSGQAFRAHVAKELGIKLSGDSKVTNFKHWYVARQELLAFNDRLETSERELASSGASDEEIRRWAIRMTYARAAAQNDAELTLKTVDRDQGEVESQRKEREFELKKATEARAERETRLAEEKFRRETCSLFLEWRTNEEANRIASSGASHAEKLDQLYLTMFGKERSA